MAKPVWESALVAIVAGVGVTALFSVGLLGVIRYSEFRRQQRPVLSALFGTIAVVALATAALSILYGLVEVA